jgi:hypothetical protein
MTKDQKKFLEIARACMALSNTALTRQERDTFAELANQWQKFATDAKACLAPLDDGSDRKKDSALRGTTDQ